MDSIDNFRAKNFDINSIASSSISAEKENISNGNESRKPETQMKVQDDLFNIEDDKVANEDENDGSIDCNNRSHQQHQEIFSNNADRFTPFTPAIVGRMMANNDNTINEKQQKRVETATKTPTCTATSFSSASPSSTLFSSSITTTTSTTSPPLSSSTLKRIDSLSTNYQQSQTIDLDSNKNRLKEFDSSFAEKSESNSSIENVTKISKHPQTKQSNLPILALRSNFAKSNDNISLQDSHHFSEQHRPHQRDDPKSRSIENQSKIINYTDSFNAIHCLQSSPSNTKQRLRMIKSQSLKFGLNSANLSIAPNSGAISTFIGENNNTNNCHSTNALNAIACQTSKIPKSFQSPHPTITKSSTSLLLMPSSSSSSSATSICSSSATQLHKKMRTTDSSSATTPNILEPSKSLEMMIDDDINYRDPTVNVIVDKTIMKQSSSIEESRKPSLSKSVPQIQSKLPISSSMNTMSNVSQNGANNGGEIIHRSKLSIDELPMAIEDNEKLSIDFVLPNAISQSSMSLVSIPNDIVTINDISCDISDDEDNEKRSITDLCSNDEDHSQLSSTYQCFNEIGPETSHQKDTFVARKSQICDAVTKNDDSAMNSSGPELISSNSDIKSDQVLSNLIECDDVESLNSLNSIEIVSEMAINNTENTSTISFISSDLNATLINARATPTSEKQQPKGSNSINHRPLNETLTRRSKTKDSIPSSTSKTTFPEYTSSRQKSSDFSIHNKSSNKENRLRSNKINEIRYRSYQSNQRRPSSRQSVQSSSRCSTPSLSEHDSIVSTLSNGSTFKNNYKKSTEKISRQQPKTNTQQNQHRQQSSQKISNLINEKRLMMMVTSNTNTAKTTKLAPNKTETTGMTRTTAAMETNQKTGIKRSATYTRSLNQATSKVPSQSTKSSNASSNQTINEEEISSCKQKSFAKPTASYLRKASGTIDVTSSSVATTSKPSTRTTNASTKHQLASNLKSRKKTSVSSSISSLSSINEGNGSENHSETQMSTTTKKSNGFSFLNHLGQLQSVTNVKSPDSSRRSSIVTSPKSVANIKSLLSNRSKDQQSVIESLEKLSLELKQSELKSKAFVVLFTFLINEYRPFETTKLRSQLFASNQKCSYLNREYELAKESSFLKDSEITSLKNEIKILKSYNDNLQRTTKTIEKDRVELKAQLESMQNDHEKLEKLLEDTRSECENEKQIRLDIEGRFERLESNLKSDKKYRELKEKVSNFEKEVDSLNVVVDMKTQRIRHLESEKMRTELELADYEQLKDSYQRLQRENEALSEALGMKARKNAEQSRELDLIRNELKREINERKRLSVRYDQLEFQLNESRDLIQNLSTNLVPIKEERNIDEGEVCGGAITSTTVGDKNESSYFTPINRLNQSMNYQDITGGKFNPHPAASNQGVESRHRILSTQVKSNRRLFSTPIYNENQPSQQKSRYHHQHQDPLLFEPSATDIKHHQQHHLPEVVLSSMNAKSLQKLIDAAVVPKINGISGDSDGRDNSRSPLPIPPLSHSSSKIYTNQIDPYNRNSKSISSKEFTDHLVSSSDPNKPPPISSTNSAKSFDNHSSQ